MAQKFILGCRIYYNGDGSLYSWYIHGFWIPWLEDQRAMGKLKQGKVFLEIANLFHHQVKRQSSYISSNTSILVKSIAKGKLADLGPPWRNMMTKSDMKGPSSMTNSMVYAYRSQEKQRGENASISLVYSTGNKPVTITCKFSDEGQISLG